MESWEFKGGLQRLRKLMGSMRHHFGQTDLISTSKPSGTSTDEPFCHTSKLQTPHSIALIVT
jgi:hypothetical protein